MRLWWIGKGNWLASMSQADPWARWLTALLLLALILVLRPSIHGNDGVQNYAYLRSLLFDGDLDFSNEYAHYFSQSPGWFDDKPIPRDPVTGKPINLYGVGNALLWAPWVLMAHAVGVFLRAWGADIALDGYSRIYEWGVGVGSAVYASVGVRLLYALLRSWFGSVAAFWSVVLVWLGTPLFFYTYFHPSMSHANSFFLSALLMYLYWRGRRQRRDFWVALGIVSGLSVLTRFQDAALVFAMGVAELLWTWRWWVRLRRRGGAVALWPRLAMRALLFSAGLAVIFSLQLWAWRELQGSAWSGPRGYLAQGRLDIWTSPHMFNALFSSFHGLFHWHPVLLLGVAGLFAPAIPARRRMYAVLGFATQAWIVGSWTIWWAGASLGQRMFISVFPQLGVGFAALFGGAERLRRWACLIVVVALWWNLGLTVQYATRAIPRQGPVTLLELARNNVLRVPALMFEKISANHRDGIPSAPQR